MRSRSGCPPRLYRAVKLLAILTGAACARPQSPSGGPPDQSGPQVIVTVPDPFSVIEASDEPIRITFNEHISEQGAAGPLDQAVQVSPESGAIEVRHRKDALEVKMEGGLHPDLVYRVTVRPTVQDLFRNAMPQPFEFVFSTGAEMLPNALAGMVFDRITGEPIEGVRVTARSQPLVEGDARGPTHVAISDSAGVFAFRYLPPLGRYVLVAWQDQNRNREADFLEPVGESFQEVSGADTLFTDIRLLRPDTTAAIVTDAEVVDSVTLTVEFDDYLDAEVPLGGVIAALALDSVPVGPPVREILHEREYLIRLQAIEDSLRVVADSLQILESTRAADSLLQAGDTAAAAAVVEALPDPPPAPEGQRGEDDEAMDLPKRSIYVILSDTLITEAAYELSVAGIININNVTSGGGTAEIVRAAPPVDSTAIADSILAADSAAAALDPQPPDTIPADTLTADTIPTPTIPTDAVPADTIRPDTLRRDGGRFGRGAAALGRDVRNSPVPWGRSSGGLPPPERRRLGSRGRGLP